MPAQPLTDTQKADAERLRALFSQWQAKRKENKEAASQEAAGELLGFGQSALSQYLRGKIPLNVNAVAKFVALIGCAPEDISPELAKEIRALSALTEQEAGLSHISVSAESQMKGTNRRQFEESGAPARDSITGTKFKNVTPARLGKRQIPVISYVQAGMMTEVVDPFSLGMGFETIQSDVECSEFSFGLVIEGDSMEPRFHEGDVVIIDPLREPRPGLFVVAKNGREEATFKKYRPRGMDERGNVVFELVPLNDDYPTLHSERDHLRVIGVCVELRQKMA